MKQNNERRNSDRIIKKGQMILAQAGIKEAGLDAWLLLEYVTGKSRAYYFAYGEESVTESVAERYLELISRRAGHIPLQHLTHQAFLWGMNFMWIRMYWYPDRIRKHLWSPL